MPMRTIFATWCVLGLLAAGALAAEWKAADQPALAAELRAAKALTVEDVCTPVSATRIGTEFWVPAPDHKSYDYLQTYYPTYGGPSAVLIASLGTGEYKTVEVSRRFGFGGASSAVAPNGKLYLFGGGPPWRELSIYDPATKELAVAPLSMPHEMRGENGVLLLGPDGKLYAIASDATGAAAACQIDPDTGKVTYYGALGPKHANDCWVTSAAADDRYLYFASGMVPWYLVAYDRETGKSEVLLTTETSGGRITVTQQKHGAVAHVTKLLGAKGDAYDFWLYRGKAILQTLPSLPPPWPETPGDSSVADPPPKPTISRAKARPDAEGNAEIWYRPATHRPMAARPGQSPEMYGWKPMRFKVPLYPVDIYRLSELPDGRLLGTPGAYHGNFLFDPATGKSVWPGECRLEQYSTAVVHGKIYMSGYPGAWLLVYDPAQPWTCGLAEVGGRTIDDPDPDSNPRRLLAMMDYGGLYNATVAAVADNEKIFCGGHWERNGSGGAVVSFDPLTHLVHVCGGASEPFATQSVAFMTTAQKGRFIVISTLAVADIVGGKPMPEQGKFFVMEPDGGAILRELVPVPGAPCPGPIVGVGGPRVLGWTVNPQSPGSSSILYGVDVAAGTVAFRKTLPFRLPIQLGADPRWPFDFRMGPDGYVWTVLDGTIVRINPDDATVVPVGKALAGPMAFAGHDLYLGGTPVLRRIRGVVGKP